MPVLLAVDGGRVRGEALRSCGSWLPATDLAATAAAAAFARGEGVGREKFCRLAALELEWAVVNCV
jgi:hypothetical protein